MALSLAGVAMMVVAGLPFPNPKNVPGPDVTVVNTAKNPVPVTLDQSKPIPVKIDATLPSNVTIANTAKDPVPVSGQVNVTASESQPVHVQSRDNAWNAFQASVYQAFGYPVYLQVTSPGRAVVETISVSCFNISSPPKWPDMVELHYMLNGKEVFFPLPLSQGPQGRNVAMFNGRLYADVFPTQTNPPLYDLFRVTWYGAPGGCDLQVIGYTP